LRLILIRIHTLLNAMYEPSWAVFMALLYGNVLDLDSGGIAMTLKMGRTVVPRNEKSGVKRGSK
jgi:hypothetical protein